MGIKIIDKAVKSVGKAFESGIKTVSNFVGHVGDELNSGIKTVANIAGHTADFVGDVATGDIDGIKEHVKRVGNAVEEGVKDVGGVLNDLTEALGPLAPIAQIAGGIYCPPCMAAATAAQALDRGMSVSDALEAGVKAYAIGQVAGAAGKYVGAATGSSLAAGAARGATSGGITAIDRGTDVGKGILQGGLTGAAASGIASIVDTGTKVDPYLEKYMAREASKLIAEQFKPSAPQKSASASGTAPSGTTGTAPSGATATAAPGTTGTTPSGTTGTTPSGAPTPANVGSGSAFDTFLEYLTNPQTPTAQPVQMMQYAPQERFTPNALATAGIGAVNRGAVPSNNLYDMIMASRNKADLYQGIAV